jgi:hypothetical protein
MEVSRQQALELLKNWERTQTTLGLHFAARGGTAGSTMLARITEVSSRIIFRSDGAVLSFGLYKARFALGKVQAMLRPSREGLAEIEGLHIWLESGHWLFICDGTELGAEWLNFRGNQELLSPPKRSRKRRESTRALSGETDASLRAETAFASAGLTPAVLTKR